MFLHQVDSTSNLSKYNGVTNILYYIREVDMSLYVIINLLILIFLSLIFKSLSILIMGIVGIFLVTYLTNKTKLKFNRLLYIIFIISIIAMLMIYFGNIQKYGTPYISGGSDDLAFETYSKYILDKGYLIPEQYIKDPLLSFHNSKGFLWILSWIMRIVEPFGGYHTIAFRVLNINLLIAIGILTTSFFKENYGFNDNKNAIILIALTLFPNALYISVHVFRDTLIIFLLFVVFYIWDIFLKRKKYNFIRLFKIISMTLVISYISYWIRNQSILFIFAIVLVSILVNERTLSLKNFGFFILLLFISMIIAEIFDLFDMIIAFNERYSIHKLRMGEGLSNIIFRMPLFPFGIFIRFAYGLVTPIPIPILNIAKMFSDIIVFFDVIVSFGTVIQILLLPYLIKNIKRIDKVFIIFVIFMLGIVITTFTFRHFIMLYPFMFILIFRQLFITKRTNRVLLLVFMSTCIVFASSVYLIIK